MSDGYDREMYEELYSIRARVESIDARISAMLSEVIKLRRFFEEDRVKKEGRGDENPALSSDKPETSYRRTEDKKKFGLF